MNSHLTLGENIIAAVQSIHYIITNISLQPSKLDRVQLLSATGIDLRSKFKQAVDMTDVSMLERYELVIEEFLQGGERMDRLDTVHSDILLEWRKYEITIFLRRTGWKVYHLRQKRPKDIDPHDHFDEGDKVSELAQVMVKTTKRIGLYWHIIQKKQKSTLSVESVQSDAPDQEPELNE
jgi:hypothetical protein